jgi:hypothetical protein
VRNCLGTEGGLRDHADLKANFGDKKHELNVSTYQMVILLLFNEADSLTYNEILHATSIPPGDLKRSLQSLACVKVKWHISSMVPECHMLLLEQHHKNMCAAVQRWDCLVHGPSPR